MEAVTRDISGQAGYQVDARSPMVSPSGYKMLDCYCVASPRYHNLIFLHPLPASAFRPPARQRTCWPACMNTLSPGGPNHPLWMPSVQDARCACLIAMMAAGGSTPCSCLTSVQPAQSLTSHTTSPGRITSWLNKLLQILC